jgi:hypothetical protein
MAIGGEETIETGEEMGLVGKARGRGNAEERGLGYRFKLSTRAEL